MTSLRIGALGLFLLACGTLLDLDDDGSDGSSSGSSDDDASVGDDDDDDSSSSSSSSGRSSSGSSSGGSSSGSASGGASSSGGAPPLWADVQLSLAQLRQQGPLTPAQSQGQCTDHYFVWKESNGTLHSWFADDGTVIDYAFTAPSRPFFRASDAYVAVDTQPFSTKIDVYRTTAANQKVTQLDRPASWGATNDGVLLVQTVSATSARIAKWTEGQGTTTLTSSDLTTQDTPSAYANGQLLLPASVTQPYPLYLVDAANGSVDSVNFAGALAYRSGLPSARGLFVSYARQGGTNALRWYRNDQDDTVEITDALALIPPYFADPPPAREHEFITYAAFGGGSTLFYGGFYGIWAYDLDAGTIEPVQLSVNKVAFAPDILCVLPGANKLVYRDSQDATGRVYWIDLAALP